MTDYHLLAADGWRIPHLGPGATVAVERDGLLYVDQVESVRYEWLPPAPSPRLSRWQRIVRRLAPRRLRKPLPRPAPWLPTLTLDIGPAGEDARAAHERAFASLQRAGEVIDGLINSESGYAMYGPDDRLPTGDVRRDL